MSRNQNNKPRKITNYFPSKNALPAPAGLVQQQLRNVPLPAPERLTNVVRLLLPSPRCVETALRHRIQGERHGPARAEVVEENVDVQVNEEGEVNGENVEMNQKFKITVRRDLC